MNGGVLNSKVRFLNFWRAFILGSTSLVTESLILVSGSSVTGLVSSLSLTGSEGDPESKSFSVIFFLDGWALVSFALSFGCREGGGSGGSG